MMLYPKLNDSRALIDLSGIWDFMLDDGHGFEEGWASAPLKDPMTIAVPASYNDQKECARFRDHYGWAFYQKEVSVPRALLSQRVVLRFAAVTHAARVYWNGELLCEHKGGFLPFETEITEKIEPGKNLLTVAADNRIDYGTLPVGSETDAAMFGSSLPDIPSVRAVKPKPRNLPNFDFFNYAGINRPVKIYTTPKSYIEDITIVPEIIGRNAEVSYQVDVVGSGAVELTVRDEAGTVVAVSRGTKGEFTIENARLWEPGSAYLYTAHVVFGEDEYEQRFGVRSVEVKGTEFLINGKPFYFKGFGKHEDSAFRGRGMDECLNVKDADLIHWLGANSFRTSHYPYAEEMYDLCDREGIVIIDEVPAVGINIGTVDNRPADTYKIVRTAEHHREVIRNLVRRDKNHPCVVMWSIANEPDTEHFPQSAYDYFHPLYELAHECDPQDRPVTLVCCQNDYTRDITTRSMDVACINRYYGWYIFGGDLDAAEQAMKTELEFWAETGKPVMLTEYGADAVPGLHLATPGMFSEEYQAEYYRRMNALIDACPFFVGEQVWNFADFNTIQGLMRVDGNKKGLLTRDRRPKLAAHYFRGRWTKIPDFGYKKQAFPSSK